MEQNVALPRAQSKRRRFAQIAALAYAIPYMNENRAAAVPPGEIVMLDAIALARAIASRQLSCVEVMNAYLDHIERLNPVGNAIVSMRPRGELIAFLR